MLQKKMPLRIVIYSKDVENITGKMPRSASRLLKQIREKFGKQKNDMVTVKEFCLYTGIEEELIADFLQH